MHDFLEARENRAHSISQALTHTNTVISIRANIPGNDKKIKEAYIICRVFFHVVNKILAIKSYQFLDLADGPSLILSIDSNNLMSIKKVLVHIEETHPIGRFVDLDVISREKTISRHDLNLTMRKCYLCGDDAHICARTQKHDYMLLLDHLKHHVSSYLSQFIYQQIDKAMLDELQLEYKFGLVTKSSSGSHPDMSYELMIKAKDVIISYLVQIFNLAFLEGQITKDIFEEARKIGVSAEKAMLHATQGVNAYKGLIFILGSVMMAIGVDLNQKDMSSDIFKSIHFIGSYIKDDFKKEYDTFGYLAYQKYHFLGARGELMSGLMTIQHTLKVFPIDTDIDDMTLRKILVNIIMQTDDTVLLKRSKSLENYTNFKKELALLDLNDINAIKSFNQNAIINNLSVGGSADLLVTYLFIKAYFLHMNIK